MSGGEVEECAPEQHEQFNWKELRRLSLVPGGFGEARAHLWPWLLRLPSSQDSQHNLCGNGGLGTDGHKSDEASDSEKEPIISDSNHQDERQIQLDTDRSFVLYPGDKEDDRETLQTELHQLLLAVFRRRPKLNYFQGYHDIISVIYLTLPPEVQLPCAEKLSLHRVRDSMGATLEPVLGLLRILRNILRLADPSFSALLEQNSPLPYYALSNLLTLFSHDMPSLPLIQHVFDFLLCRPPIAVVYLAAALILSRRQEVERLQQEGEEGMVHSLLSGIPDLLDDAPLNQNHATGENHIPIDVKDSSSNDTPQKSLNGVLDIYEPLEGTDEQSSRPSDASTVHDSDFDLASNSDTTLLGDDSNSPQPKIVDAISSSLEPESNISSRTDPSPDSKAGLETAEEDDRPRSRPISPLQFSFPPRPTMPLTSLLARADELRTLYPPSHPAISVSSIMGPQSVLFTWSEEASEMPEDDDAELMVSHPELIVRPYIELHPHSKGTDDETEVDKKKRLRKLCESPRIGWIAIERRTLIAGAVVILGIGLAVYSIRARPTVTQSGIHYGKRMRTWIGKAITAAGG